MKEFIIRKRIYLHYNARKSESLNDWLIDMNYEALTDVWIFTSDHSFIISFMMIQICNLKLLSSTPYQFFTITTWILDVVC